MRKVIHMAAPRFCEFDCQPARPALKPYAGRPRALETDPLLAIRAKMSCPRANNSWQELLAPLSVGVCALALLVGMLAA